MHRDVDWYTPRHLYARHITVVIGLEDDDLVARINQPHDSAVDALGGARGHDDARLRIDIESIENLSVPGDALAQGGEARAGRVLIGAIAIEGVNRRVDYRFWSVKIGLALPKVDGIVPRRQLIDLGEDGRAERRYPLCVGGHEICPALVRRIIAQL